MNIKSMDRKNKKFFNLKYDGVLTISTGTSRRETKWKNEELRWSEFLKRVRQTTYTEETYEEYIKLSKGNQDNIRDVGGFIGGILKDGRRKGDSVQSRTVLTLEAEFAPEWLWDTIELLFDFACCSYSNHNHKPEEPRLRLVIPLSRPVSPEEYEAVARKVAADIGIEYFDDTTFDPSKVMYWPSTSRDGVYEFGYMDTQWLNPDKILRTYRNWRNTLSWPRSSRCKKNGERAARKQENPKHFPRDTRVPAIV